MGYFDLLQRKKQRLPSEAEALPGRSTPMALDPHHFVLGTSMKEPFPAQCETVYFGMGCFWGAEKLFWSIPGVHTTAVGYGAGYTPNPTYEEVCSGMTGHNELVMVVFDPAKVSYDDLLQVFWQSHNPTEGMRQGHDIGTQYRSGIYIPAAGSLEFLDKARSSQEQYDVLLKENGKPKTTTELGSGVQFFYAESYHQQYLAKNPSGYCPNHTCEATGLPSYEPVSV